VGVIVVDEKVAAINISHEVEVLTSFKALEEIVPEWEELALKEYPGHPFADPDWVISWLECFSREQDIRVLVVRAETKIRGIVPLVLARKKYYGVDVMRLGLPFNDHSPRCDVLVSHTDASVFESVLESIKSWAKQWDIFELPHIATDGNAYVIVKQCTEHSGAIAGEWAGSMAPYLMVEGAWEAFWQQLRSKRRTKLRSRRRRLEEHGPVELEMVVDVADLELALEDGYRIEAAAWKGVNGTAIQSDRAVSDFYTKLAYRMARKGRLRLFFLKVGKERIAFAYMLELDEKLFALKQGYLPEFSAMSPSTLLVIDTLKYAFENGIKEYDFLGVDDTWKREWANRLREHRWIMTFSGSPRSRAIFAMKSVIVPWVKNARKVYRSIREKGV
jgi:CelD/BcsL family acetyltransferase involved in cellulose biosynthesis